MEFENFQMDQLTSLLFVLEVIRTNKTCMMKNIDCVKPNDRVL